MHLRSLAFRVALSGICLGVAAPIHSVMAAEQDSLGEIVVTAEKRATPESKTPISMDVFSGAELSADGVHDVATLSRLDPTLNFGSSGQGAIFLTIRGVSSRDASEIGDPAVPVSIDGFFQDRTYALNASTFDLERVEVLRGPQGTLYGRNAIGGAVNFITQKPTDEFGGYGTIDFGNFQFLHTEGAVNIPLSDTVQIRAAFASYTHQGYRFNPEQNSRNDDEDTQSGRVSVAFQPFDGFAGLVTGQYTRGGGAGQGYQEVPFSYNATSTDIYHSTPAGINFNSYSTLVPFQQQLTEYRLHWELNYTLFANATVSYVGGYDYTHFFHVEDDSNAVTQTPAKYITDERPETQNHELRIASSPNQRVTWQGGLFYFVENSSLNSAFRIQTANGFPPAFAFPYPTVQTDSYAAFGTVNFQVIDSVKLSLGARENYDDKNRIGTALLYPQLLGLPPSSTPIATSVQNGSSHSNRPTYHVGVDWTPTADSLIYGKFDTGYKAGGFNSNGLMPSTQYGPETAKNYELGVKQWVFDRSVEVKGDVFYENYYGYQAQLGACPTCSNASSIANAGAATIKGVEGSINANINPIGRINLSIDYLSAKFTNFLGLLTTYQPGGGSMAVAYNLAGDSTIQSPKISATAGIEHSWELSNQGTLTAQAQTSFRTAQYFSNYNFEDSRQGAYELTDAYLQYTSPGDRYEVQAYGRNLANTDYLTFALEDGTARAYKYAFGAPRTVGIKLTVKFR
jgi:iron complex outermembrane recepter protein